MAGRRTKGEIGATSHTLLQSWRNFRRRYPPKRLPDMLRDRWWDQMITPERAVQLFVGNIAAHPRTFLLLGLFRPTVAALKKPEQESLF